MSKKKFSLSSDFVKVAPEEPVVTQLEENPIVVDNSGAKLPPYTGPNSNRIRFSSSMDKSLNEEFKVWVAKKRSNISTELENAIKLIMNK